jgi:shikimate kinase
MILVGLMGSGKSTIGKLLASRLSLPLVDSDKMIIAEEGKDIPSIFAEVGEAGFRNIESACLKEALNSYEDQVIATGGGAVLSQENRSLMKKHRKVVWLDASPETLAKRIAGDRNRPLLDDVDPLEKMKALTVQRNPLYAEIADLKIDTEQLTTKQAVDKITAFLSE